MILAISYVSSYSSLTHMKPLAKVGVFSTEVKNHVHIRHILFIIRYIRDQKSLCNFYYFTCFSTHDLSYMLYYTCFIIHALLYMLYYTCFIIHALLYCSSYILQHFSVTLYSCCCYCCKHISGNCCRST